MRSIRRKRVYTVWVGDKVFTVVEEEKKPSTLKREMRQKYGKDFKRLVER